MISIFGSKKSNQAENQTFKQHLEAFDFDELFDKSKVQRNVPTNLQAVNFIKGEKHILLVQNPRVTGKSKTMVIEREGCKISETLADDYMDKNMIIENRLYSALLGICFYAGEAHLIFAKNMKLKFNLNGHEIYEIEKVCAIGVVKGEENAKFTKSLRKLFGQGFMLSYTMNMTQRLTATDAKKQRPNHIFWWNRFLYEVIPPELKEDWTLYVVCGGLTHRKISIRSDLSVDVILYSRRSTRECAPYPFAIGINSLGENANFCIHELIVKSGNEKIMYKYSSGSPPFMFSISRETAMVSPKKTFRKNLMALKCHVEWIKVKGGQSCLLAMVHPQNEFKKFIPLLDIIEKEYQRESEDIHIWKYDYSSSFAKNDLIKYFEKTSIFKKVERLVKTQGVTLLESAGCDYAFDAQKGKIHFSIASFRRMPFLAHSAVIFAVIRRLNSFKDIKSEAFPMSTLNQLINDHLYCLFACYDRGRHKLLKKTSTGMINELKIPILPESRNYEMNDMIKVCGMNTALTMSKKLKLIMEAPVEARIPSQVKVFVLSWNVAGFSPTSLEALEPLFNGLNTENLPDIVVIGLQEVVELKAKNFTSFFGSKEKKSDEWEPSFTRILKRLGNYKFLIGKRMVGLRSLVYIRDTVKHSLYGIRISDVKTGMMGLVGNKGSVITSLYMGDSLINFANTHLPSGGSNSSKRATCVADLYKQKIEVEKSDFFFLFGDLNLRVQLKLEEYKKAMLDFQMSNMNIDWEMLKSKDEVALGEQPCLNTYFKEAPLTQNPTYRLVKGTSKYSDERVASWTDRIFFYYDNEDFKVEIIDFGSLVMSESDHLPVYGTYKINVKNYDYLKLFPLYKKLFFSSEGDSVGADE